MPILMSGTRFSTSSTRRGEISLRKLSDISSYQVEMKIPLSGYRMKLSEILSIMMVRFRSLPSKERSLTRNGPF